MKSNTFCLILVISLSVVVGVRCGGQAEAIKDSVPVGARTKIETEPGVIQSAPASLIYVRILDPTDWVVADEKTLWKTTDGGATWKKVSGYSGNEIGRFVGGLSFINDKVGFAVVDSKLLKTVDGGETWATVGKMDFGTKDVEFTDEMNGWAVGSDWDESAIDGNDKSLWNGFVRATTDGGITWRVQVIERPKFPREFRSARWEIRNVFFFNKNRGFAVGTASFFNFDGKSGKWVQKNGFEKEDLEQVYFNTPEIGWVRSYGGGGFLLTADGGENWAELKEPFDVPIGKRVIYFVSRDRGFWLDDAGNIYETNNGARDWSCISGGDAWDDLRDREFSGDIFAGSDNQGHLVLLWLVNTGNDVLRMQAKQVDISG